MIMNQDDDQYLKKKKEDEGDKNNLLDGSGPRQGKTKEDNEEKGTPKIPITQRLTRVFPIRIRKNNKLQITNNPR